MTYDRLHKFTCDAWNRLSKVERAYRSLADNSLQPTSAVGTITYDALGRRVTKTVGDDCSTTREMGDWEAVYRYYYDGDRVVEERDGSERVLRQYVWGTQYVDELIQVAVNQDPEDTTEDHGGACEYERYLWALHDGNYNVTGLVNRQGWLVERYEYTPYGQRTVYSRGWSVGDLDGDGVVNEYDWGVFYTEYEENPPDSNAVADLDGDGDVDDDDASLLSGMMTGQIPPDLDGMVQNPVLESARGRGLGLLVPLVTGLCDFGMQGKLFDKEFGTYRWGAREYHPVLARAMQTDPLGNPDGNSRFEWECSNPVTGLDPAGLYESNNGVFDTDFRSDAEWDRLLKKLNEAIRAELMKAYKATGEKGPHAKGGLWDTLAKDATWLPLSLLSGERIDTGIDKMIFSIYGQKAWLRAIPLKIGGYSMGQDKISHMFEQGGILHAIWLSRERTGDAEDCAKAFSLWTEGLLPSGTHKQFSHFIDSGTLTIPGLGWVGKPVRDLERKWGGKSDVIPARTRWIVRGIGTACSEVNIAPVALLCAASEFAKFPSEPSWADHHANLQGFKMWQWLETHWKPDQLMNFDISDWVTPEMADYEMYHHPGKDYLDLLCRDRRPMYQLPGDVPNAPEWWHLRNIQIR